MVQQNLIRDFRGNCYFSKYKRDMIHNAFQSRLRRSKLRIDCHIIIDKTYLPLQVFLRTPPFRLVEVEQQVLYKGYLLPKCVDVRHRRVYPSRSGISKEPFRLRKALSGFQDKSYSRHVLLA